MKYKYIGGYRIKDGFWNYGFSPIEDKMNTEINIQWDWIGRENLSNKFEYREEEPFESIDEIWTELYDCYKQFKESGELI